MTGLVLAAGAGRRFGGPKALVDFRGVRLVDRAVGLLRAGGCDRVLVVSGAVELDVPGTPLQRPWHLVTHPDATASTELLLAHVLATSPWHRP